MVAWERVCFPKSAGGLNVLDIAVWNKAAISKLLWALTQKKEKLWIVRAESTDPLFFKCAYSGVVWSRLLCQLQIQCSASSFVEIVKWIAVHGRKQSPQSQLLLMGFVEAIYGIWIQRNKKIFDGTCKHPDGLFRDRIFLVLCRCNDRMKTCLIG